MQTYSKFRPTGFDAAGICLPDRQNWLVAPVSQTRDSGPLDKSNFETALEMLGGESDTIEVHRFGHWGPGWFEIVLINPEAKELVKIGDEIEGSLENYPVLDESHYSRLEHEEYIKSWDFWGRKEYCRGIRARLFEEFSNGVSEEFSDAEIEDAVSELDNEAIDSLREKASQGVNWEYQSESSGVTINIKGLIAATDTDALADMAIEYCRQARVSADITALARLFGASQEAINLAIRFDFRLASQIRNLAMTH